MSDTFRQSDNRDMHEIERSNVAQIEALQQCITQLQGEIAERDRLIERLRKAASYAQPAIWFCQ